MAIPVTAIMSQESEISRTYELTHRVLHHCREYVRVWVTFGEHQHVGSGKRLWLGGQAVQDVVALAALARYPASCLMLCWCSRMA